MIVYLVRGYVAIPTYGFCKVWLCFNFSLNVATLFLTVQLSFERYLFIFHHHFLHR